MFSSLTLVQLTFEATRERCSQRLCESEFILSTLCCPIAWNCFQTWPFYFISFALVIIVKLTAGLTIVHKNSRSYLMKSSTFWKISTLKGRRTNIAAVIYLNKNLCNNRCDKNDTKFLNICPVWHRLFFVYLYCGKARKGWERTPCAAFARRIAVAVRLAAKCVCVCVLCVCENEHRLCSSNDTAVNSPARNSVYLKRKIYLTHI